MTPRVRAGIAAAAAALLGAGCAGDRTVDVTAPERAPSAAAGPSAFGPRSIWRTPLAADAELDPRSEQLVDGLVRQVEDAGPYFNTARYSTPIVTAGSRTRPVPVRLTQGTPSLRRAFLRVPLPPTAAPAPGNDRQLVVVQPSKDRMWELFGLRRERGRWTATYGGRIDHLSADVGYYTGAHRRWGATATSLPLLGGLVRLDEARAGRVDHALALEVPEVAARVVRWPAQRTDGDSVDPDALPEGTWLRLDPTLDVASLRLPPFVATLAMAAQRYGVVVRDRSGAVDMEGEQATGPDGGDPWLALFAGRPRDELMGLFPWARLQVVTPSARRVGVRAGAQPGGEPPSAP